ncbi:TonB family protein [Pontibacter aydingkolensis]|uniref:TonB family protein n=1 Tax=Pontibacter aydingkolensis TaxID=1911536 RepID=A0ABS7CUZ9_9BACT|nr:M56 family metallopeptidase [Pontibacter aydingkolensis]MBW7467632.1 TonB family protein [Pontibacter aydingkolensis]
MELTISYILKTVLLLLALYLFYYSLLRNQNSFSFNRLYLLLAPLVALVLPLLKWPVAFAPENAISVALQAIQLTEVTVTAYGTGKKAVSETSDISLATMAAVAYSVGILLVLAKLVKQLWQVQSVKAEAESATSLSDGIHLYQLPAHIPTFAFGSNIFLSKQSHLSKSDQDQVLEHELAHVKLRHTWDVLYYEILSAILWANPVVWLLKQELRDVHEYQADARVISTYKAQNYTSLLSKEALLNMGLPIGSYFQKPQVLKRLQMLQLSGQKPAWTRQLLVLPFILGLLFIFSVQQVDAQTGILAELTQEVSMLAGSKPLTEDNFTQETKPTTEQPEINAVAKTSIKPEPLKEEKVREAFPSSETANKPDTKATSGAAKPEKPFVYVEQMPSFKGGEIEMLKYLAKNIRYPKESQEAGTSGLVVLGFIVEKDGSLKDIQVIKSLDESTDAEARRVVESMNGSWEPGKQNGVPVQVRYTLPVRFQIK